MKTQAKIASAALGTALLFSGGAAPASAAPVASTTKSTSVTPLLGVGAGSYQYWCNWWGYFCKKAKRIQNWGSFESICSDLWCTEFYYSKKHPKPYQIKKISAVRYY